jgi:AcrR family transcriptional regulator
MKPEARRRAIIDAAHTVARRQGLSTTTVRDVAEEMGTSSGLIHHYFASMDELLAVVFAEVAEADLSATRQRMDHAESAVGRLAAYLAGFTDPENDVTVQFWLDAWSEAGRNQTIRQTSRALNVEWHRILSSVIREGVESGEFDDVDADVVAWMALSLLDGLSLQVVPHRKVISRSQAAAWAAESIERDLGLQAGSLLSAEFVK